MSRRGVILLLWGHNIADSLDGRIQNLVTGSPGDKPMWLCIDGGVPCALGLFQILVGKSTGGQTIVSSAGYFPLSKSLAVGTDRKIYVSDAAADKVLQIDPDTGAQTIIGTMPGPEEIIVVPIPRPTLTIERTGTQLSLLWPTSAENFVLEFTEQFPVNAGWTAKTNMPDRVGDQNQLTIEPTNATGFFRLRR